MDGEILRVFEHTDIAILREILLCDAGDKVTGEDQ